MYRKALSKLFELSPNPINAFKIDKKWLFNRFVKNHIHTNSHYLRLFHQTNTGKNTGFQ